MNIFAGVEDDRKLKALILHLLSKQSAQLKTEIVKQCFLIDREYAKKKNVKEGFSTTQYIRYLYGPYSKAFADVLDELERQGYIELVRENDFSYVYVLTERSKEFPYFSLLDDDVKQIVEVIVSNTREKSLEQVKAEVYALDEFKKTSFEEKINFIG